jgi:hypothetical protein
MMILVLGLRRTLNIPVATIHFAFAYGGDDWLGQCFLFAGCFPGQGRRMTDHERRFDPRGQEIRREKGPGL